MIETLCIRYRRYRGYGHGRFVAATLAPPPEWLLFALCGVIGWHIGNYIWYVLR